MENGGSGGGKTKTGFKEAKGHPWDIDRKLEMVNSWLTLLTETERAVINLRFGFRGKDALTVESTGECLGLTPERVREIEAKTIEKLRAISQKKDKDLAA
jgi:RNA polymerase primary sigma factor